MKKATLLVKRKIVSIKADILKSKMWPNRNYLAQFIVAKS